MRSDKPKVLHEIASTPILEHIVRAAAALNPLETIVIYGHGGEQVKQRLAHIDGLKWAEQKEQLGTGHAVQQALPQLAKSDVCLVVVGDIPLIQTDTLAKLVAASNGDKLAVLSVILDNPSGYGRIVKNSAGEVVAIVEEKDTNAEQKLITEINTGVMAIPGQHLEAWLSQLDNNNAQDEYYLTDLIKIAHTAGFKVSAAQASCEAEVSGINNKLQLATLEREFQLKQANALMLEGATLVDPSRIDIRGSLKIGRDVEIDVNCVFIGDVTLGDGVKIASNCVIENSTVGANSVVKANSVLENSSTGESCDIGPFARLRPGTQLGNKAKIGNFVETKKSIIGDGSKVNHLSYIGDADIGSEVNVGAGTITCNYDGVNKFKTTIGDNAFIGSNSSLVAPIEIGAGATVGAGSTVSKVAPEAQLTITRAKQKSIEGWQRPVKVKE
jgi:bifunctional UDP-N-acetylglucosamine pyrophosphorylase/glucosamine-1-phosphate N-acetyltransferase